MPFPLDKQTIANLTRGGRNAHLLALVTEPVETKSPMSEYDEQVELFRLCEANSDRFPELKWLFAVPNGELRAKSVAARLKRAGVKSGVSDVILLEPRNGYHGLCIELKTKTGTATPEQKRWLKHHAERGYSTWICQGHRQAWSVIKEYLGVKP